MSFPNESSIANPSKFEARRGFKSSKIWKIINDDAVAVITVL